MRYYFNLSDGRHETDESGTDLPDEGSARYEAIRFAGELLKSEPQHLDHGPLCVHVNGEDGSERFSIEIKLIS